MCPYLAVTQLMEKLASEGVERDLLAECERDLVNAITKARLEKAVVDMFPVIGSQNVAAKLGIAKSTVYKIIHRQRKKFHELAKA